MEGLVSTVIPVYNRSAMLREAVESVLAQTWRPIEIIIVDDGSTDDTVEVADALRAAYPEMIRCERQSNAGPGVARQAGLTLARGEFIQFLDSDDLLLPEKFAKQISALRSDPEAQIAYSKTFSDNGGVRSSQPAQRSGQQLRHLFPALLAEPIWPTLTPLYRHEFLQKVGPWPASRQLEDWQYDAQAAAHGATLCYVDEYLSVTRNHDGDRLCRLWQSDVSAMRDRVDAYANVLAHARTAGVERHTPEMQQFARSLFWMARSAGAYGLPVEAKRLFSLARECTSQHGPDFFLYAFAARLLGWRLIGKAAGWLDRWRK